jgi:hypothetical protein
MSFGELRALGAKWLQVIDTTEAQILEKVD